MDWDAGEYERIAAQLLPAAQAVIDRAGPRPGERVVDIGCGTGNAALLAAERGARVTGIDPAERLLGVAEAAAAARGADATFLRADAASLPVRGSSADAVVSVFGVIFAPDAAAAAEEMARITSPGGRIVFSAWMPGGPLADIGRLRGQALAAAGAPAGPAPFAWHDRPALTELFAPLGFSIDIEERRLAFSGACAEDFLDGELGANPAWVAALTALQPGDAVHALRNRALEILAAANEDAAGFRVTSGYTVAIARRA
jgi:SAM-dependent methyltransferase